MSKRRFQPWLLLSIMGMVTGPSLAGTPRGERDLPSFAAGGPPVVFRSDSLLLAAGDRMLRVGFVGARQCSPVGAAAAGRVVYEGLWDGIDLVCEPVPGGLLKITYRLAPGADPGAIRLQYGGEVSLTAAGELSVSTPSGRLTEGRPVSWTETATGNVPVASAYRLGSDGTVGFEVSGWDGETPLVIDPVAMWHTFLGGASGTGVRGKAVAVDAAGNVYVAGYSLASWGAPIRPFAGGTEDAFVAKLDAEGHLLWHTFLGGASMDSASAIALDGSGNVYVAGSSWASWGDPVRPFQTPSGGRADGFVAKLNADGSLEANTFLGEDSTSDECNALVVGETGSVYVAGSSESSWGTPTIPHSSGFDAFVALLDADLALLGNAFLGGEGDDYGQAIDIGPSGGMFIAGDSDQTWGTPVRSFSTGTYWENDAFVAKVNAAGSLVWITFLGSTDHDRAYGIAVDGSGNAYVTGKSDLSWGTPAIPFAGGTSDAFAAALTTNGALVGHHFLGGTGADEGRSIALDGAGGLYVAGKSNATWGSPIRGYTAGISDAFVAKIGTGLVWNTFLGGSGNEGADGVAADGLGRVFVTGYSDTSWGTPVEPFPGGSACLVARLDYRLTVSGTVTCNGGPVPGVTVTFSNGLGTATTDAAGVYSKRVPYRYSGSVTPSQTGLSFTPALVALTEVVADATGLDFSATTSLTYTISGWVTRGGGLAGVTMAGLSGTPVTDSTGYYSATVPFNWSGTVTPTLAGYTFSPASRTYVHVLANQVSQNYTATRVYTVTFVAGAHGSLTGTTTQTVASGGATTAVTAVAASGYSFVNWTGSGFTTSTANPLTVTGVSANLTITANFVQTPTLTVTAPNGGESWIAGTSHNVTWTSTGSIANVKIDYSTSGGSSWTTVIASTANDGSHAWTIPATPATTCRVRVSNAANAAITDQSNANFTIVSATPPAIGLNHTRLNFGKAGSAVTSAQTLLVRNTGGGTLNWTATPSASWIVLDKTSGSGAGRVQVSVNPAGLGNGTYNGTITVAGPAAGNSPQTVTVSLTVKAKGASPSGLFETPSNNATGVTGSIAVTGWVVDDVEITAVQIYRSPLAGEGTAPIYIGDACLVEGARPDVEALYADSPFNYRAGFGYMLLTYFLPAGGNGTFTLIATAVDRDGHSAQIGSKRITCDNAHATLPFGAIDTPSQGGTASGSSYVNFGWALTPLPGTIPVDGSTLWVWVDGAPLGHPTYDQYREDIATLFPGYANSDGAVGFYYLDPSSLAEGVHTIAWSARDDLGREDGIGSRYFSVSHGESFNPIEIDGTNNDSPLAKPPTEGSVSHDEPFNLAWIQENDNGLSVVKPPTEGSVSHDESFHLIGTDLVGAYGRTPLPNPGDSAIDTPQSPSGMGTIEEQVLSSQPLRVRHGFSGTEETLYPDREGVVVVMARAGEPLAICLDPDYVGANGIRPIYDPALPRTGSTIRFAGGERVGTDLRPLPVGSRLDPDTGIFTWLPGPGFAGDFELEFSSGRSDGTVRRQRVTIRLD